MNEGALYIFQSLEARKNVPLMFLKTKQQHET